MPISQAVYTPDGRKVRQNWDNISANTLPAWVNILDRCLIRGCPCLHMDCKLEAGVWGCRRAERRDFSSLENTFCWLDSWNDSGGNQRKSAQLAGGGGVIPHRRHPRHTRATVQRAPDVCVCVCVEYRNRDESSSFLLFTFRV